jgi:glycosyltransferase involved in cell wall biosynthesis
MGPQDGVDIVVRATAIVVHELHREDIAFTLIGSGDCFDELVALRDQPNLAGHVEFTGRVPDEHVTHIMSTRYSRLMRHVRQAQASLYGQTVPRACWCIHQR